VGVHPLRFTGQAAIDADGFAFPANHVTIGGDDAFDEELAFGENAPRRQISCKRFCRQNGDAVSDAPWRSIDVIKAFGSTRGHIPDE
jgi:hypothetical protein